MHLCSFHDLLLSEKKLQESKYNIVTWKSTYKEKNLER